MDNDTIANTAANVTVEVDPDYGYQTVHVTLPSAGQLTIDVRPPRIAFGETKPATVNWPAIGSVAAEDAAAFADSLRIAADIATELNDRWEQQTGEKLS